MKKHEMERKIKQLKNNLIETDYKAIKFAEGVLTLSEYAETKAQRQELRRQIRELEEQLGV